jgi:hypothetical protein
MPISHEKSLILAIPENKYFSCSILSSILFMISGFFPNSFSNIINIVNTPTFLLFFLGMNNRRLFFQKSSKNELTETLLVSALLGIFVSMVIGHLFLMLKLPFYSKITITTLACQNVLLSIYYHGSNEKLIFFIDRDTKIKLITMLIFFIVRVIFLNPNEAFYDDRTYLNMALKFIQNNPVISEPFDDLENNYFWGIPIFLGINLTTFLPGERIWSILLSKYIFIITTTFLIEPIYNLFSSIFRSRKMRILCTLTIICNQWLFYFGLVVHTDLFFFFFFSCSVIYFLQFLKGKEPKSSLSISVLCICLNSYTKVNGVLQYGLMMFFLLIFLVLAKKGKNIMNLQIRTDDGDGIVPLDNHQVQQILSRSIIFMIIFALFVPFWFVISYLLRNGFDPFSAFFIHPQGFFGTGQIGVFTPTDRITIEWALEKLSYNIPRFNVCWFNSGSWNFK